MVEADAGGLVEIDEPHLGAVLLAEPDRRRVVDAEVPRRMDRQPRVPRHLADPALGLRRLDQRGVIGAGDRRLEAALELLRIFLGRHAPLRVLELRSGEDARLARLVERREPALLGFRMLIEPVEAVAAARRADEERPALPVGERRPHDLAEDPRRHLAELVEHHPVQIDAAQRVRIVGAEQCQPRPVRQIDAKLRLAPLRPRNRRGKMLEIVPGDRFRLPVGGRQIGEARPRQVGARRRPDQVVDAEDRFSEAPMGDHHIEPPHLPVQQRLQPARPVGQLDQGFPAVAHARRITCSVLPPAPSPSAVGLP